MSNNIVEKILEIAIAPTLVVEKTALYFKLDIQKGYTNTRIAYYSNKPKFMTGKAGFLQQFVSL